MAAKRVIRYRGQTIRVWDKSYQINSEPVLFVGDLPCVGDIKRLIDERIASRPEPYALSEQQRVFNHRKASLWQRVRDWFELRIGVGGDLHRQVWYAWRDYPDAMKLTIALFFALGSLFATLAMIVGAWFIRG
jgi:hypothetical protein